jgi:hypothetical protein
MIEKITDWSSVVFLLYKSYHWILALEIFILSLLVDKYTSKLAIVS